MPSSEDVDRWKIEQLDRLGFGIADINTLLLWRVDMHDVWRVMGTTDSRTPCTPELALRILCPLDVPVSAVVEEAHSVLV